VTTARPGPGSVFGEMPLLGLRMRAGWAEALTEAQLCLMSSADVRRLMLDDPRIALRIAEHLGARVGELEQRLADVSGSTVAQRIAQALCTLTGPAGSGSADPARLTHAQLAGLVGATRERGLVTLHRGRIRVVAPDALSALADAGRVAPGARARPVP
jgi:CRP/FNR family transcriptional regulator, cyclic AMP receptor protein